MQGAQRVIPTGAAIAGAYGPGIAPAGYGPGGSVSAANSTRVAGGAPYVAELVMDPKHCQWKVHNDEGDLTQCRGWPVKDEDKNPDRYCVGHLKKATHGDEPAADEGLRSPQS